MQLDVICAPTELPLALATFPGAACAVIDVVRATTSLLVMGEQGLASAYVVAGVESARALAAAHPTFLLAGEVGARPPVGFAFGNSPAVFARAHLAGRHAILSTTNGTRTLVAAWQAGAGAISVAALRNATAVARRALATPSDGTFYLVCAGRDQRVALDDLYTAGIIVRHAQALAAQDHVLLDLTEQARLALLVALSAGDPLTVLSQSDAGRSVQAAGLAADLPWCADVDATDLVPVVTPTAEGLLLVTYPR